MPEIDGLLHCFSEDSASFEHLTQPFLVLNAHASLMTGPSRRELRSSKVPQQHTLDTSNKVPQTLGVPCLCPFISYPKSAPQRLSRNPPLSLRDEVAMPISHPAQLAGRTFPPALHHSDAEHQRQAALQFCEAARAVVAFRQLIARVIRTSHSWEHHVLQLASY